MDFQFDSRLDSVTLSEAGVKIELKDALGAAMKTDAGAVAITVLGPDSAKYRTVLENVARDRNARLEIAKAAGTPLVEQPNENEIAVLTGITIGWENVNTAAGDPIVFTPENVSALYAYPVIREQVDRFISNRANFLKASSQA